MESTQSDFINFQIIRDSIYFEEDKYFHLHLKDVYNDLSIRLIDEKDEKNKTSKSSMNGISKIFFNTYFNIPLFISDKIFNSFDYDSDGFLNEKEFIEGLTKLFIGSFNETAQIIFNIFDYDKDGSINKGDVKVLLSYLPREDDIHADVEINYKNQMKSLSELDEVLILSFGKNSSLKYSDFINMIQNKHSDIYINLLCFLYENKPFKIETINKYKFRKNKISSPQKKILSVNTKFEGLSLSSPRSGSNITLKSPKSENIPLPSPCKNSFKSTENYFRKIKTFEKIEKKKEISSPEVKLKCPKRTNSYNVIDYSEKKQIERHHSSTAATYPTNNVDSPEKNKNEMVRYTANQIIQFKLDDQKAQESQKEDISHEDWIFNSDDINSPKKLSTSNEELQKYYMVLRGKELFFYSNNHKDELLNFHNLSNCFVTVGKTISIQKFKYYSFSIIFSKNLIKNYFTNSESAQKNWIIMIKKALGYENFNDYYEITSDLNESLFGNVKIGKFKLSEEKVAVKIIHKTEINYKDYELIQNEIYIGKTLYHNNIVRFLDHFENERFIYIIMQYLGGGNILQFLVNNYINEKQAATIIYSVAQAVKYMNSIGIVHRDIKPENIMLTDESEVSKIKLIDFGLAKILGPHETLEDIIGTITFVAPEVLNRKPYNRQIDVWSIGVLLYFLLTKSLPFYDESKNEKIIANQIAFQYIDFSDNKYSNISPIAIKLIESCLEKNPEKRITIEQILKNEWIKNYISK